ncbi:MAG: hypothetical protein H6Q90_705 [Deltaproteobacteria bacterium]|nr:hypothetical protein [Deltaproteobacteria bacterium]
MMRPLLHSVVAIGMVISACGPEPRAPKAMPAKADPELLRTLAVLATSQTPSPSELEQTRRRLDAGQLTVAGYIDGLLATKAFESEVAPLIILRQFLNQNALGAPEGFGLSHTDGPRSVYYLFKPCKWEEAVAVRPWWALLEGTEDSIRVCPDSYRPDQWMVEVPKGEPEMACLSENTPYLETTTNRCGCGPNLIRCFDSSDRHKQLAASMRDEVKRSVAYNIAHNLPVEQIFTSNESFRDRNAEFLMRTFTAENARREIPEASFRELASWPTAGKWAPREDLAPGQNAGILTSPQIVHFNLDRRQRMTSIDDVLWCIDPDSVGASPETLLSIVGADLQIKSEGWKDLAARPICTNCHARLDYGFQFFWGFTNDNLQAFFTPKLQLTGRGPLYVRDIQDSRGEAELNPHGFAQLAVAQPEFRHCMARDFAEYVLGNQVTPGQISAVEASMRPNATSARELMRTSLHALVTVWPARHAAATAQRTPEPARPPRDTISPVGELHAQLETHCLDCHDHEAGRPDLSAARLDRSTVVGMLETVAFGKMPKDHPLAEPERTRFLDAFIGSIWAGPDATAARAYFIDRSDAIPSYRPEVAFALIHRIASAKGPTSWRMMEDSVRSDLQQVTPGLITVTSLAAIEACRVKYKTRAELDRCISDAIKLSNLSGRPR